MFNVGSQLRKVRRRSNLTLDQLAASSGVDRGTISRIELGHVSPRIDTIGFLCEAMGTNLSAFFGAPELPADPAPAAPEPAPAPGPRPAIAAPPRSDGDGYWPVPTSLWHGLLEVLDRFEALVKNSSELILVQDRAGYILYASPSCESILGLRSPDLVGLHCWSLLHPSDLPPFEALVEALALKANGTSRMEYRMRHKDGSWRWIAGKFTNQLNNPSIQALVLNGLESKGPNPA
jgi:PAS domain S-box-containing protein